MVTTKASLGPLNWLTDRLSKIVQAAVGAVAGARERVGDFKQVMRDNLTDFTIAAYMAGSGDMELSAEALKVVKQQVATQLEALDGFTAEIAAGELSEEAIAARAEMYANSLQAPYWGGSLKDIPYPAVPGQDTECLCITTPESRVLTARGLVPISEVVPGDMVWTHASRWRKVTASIVRPSRPTHKQAYIKGDAGLWVGCTTDHRWLTPDVWQDSISIYTNELSVYNMSHEKDMRFMWDSPIQPEYNRFMQTVSVNLPLREHEGLPSGGMPVLRNESQGYRAMGRPQYTPVDSERYSPGTRYSTAAVPGHQRIDKMAVEVGRETLYLLPNGGRREAIYLSLPVGMGTGQWFNTAIVRDTPQEREQGGRPTGEPGTADQAGASSPSYGRGTEEGDGEWSGIRVYRGANLHLPDLPESFQVKPSKPEVLLLGVLPQGTPLYDLTVEEDHSFVIEGMVCHNSNCHCTWRVEEVNAEKGDYDLYWELGDSKQHCGVCLFRSNNWNPYKVRSGNLES